MPGPLGGPASFLPPADASRGGKALRRGPLDALGKLALEAALLLSHPREQAAERAFSLGGRDLRGGEGRSPRGVELSYWRLLGKSSC